MAIPSALLDDSRTANAPGDRTAAAWVFVAALGLFAALAWPVAQGKIYSGGDLRCFNLPLRMHYADCLARGDAFDWHPGIYCGFFLTGEGQVGTYHPWHWLLYRTLPFAAAFNLEIFASYPLMFAGMLGFLRRSGRSWPAAAFGALAFAFSGFSLMHLNHPNAVGIVAHLPWLAWALDIAATDPSPRRRAAAWAAVPVLSASQILLGYPQYVWMSCFVEVFWAARVAPRGAKAKTLALFAAAKALAGVMAAVQLLPTHEQLANSARAAAGASVADVMPLHPLEALQLGAPYLFRHRTLGDSPYEYGLYAGAVPLAFAAWAFAAGGAARRTAFAWLALAGAALWLALGRAGLLYELQTLLPVVGNFRVPARYIVVVNFALAALASLGFDAWRTANRAPPALAKLVGFSAFATLAVTLLLPASLRGAPLAALVGPLLLAAAAALTVRTRAVAALVLLTAGDLGWYGLSYAWAEAERLEDIVASAPPRAPDAPRLAMTLPRPGAATEIFMGNQYVLRGARLADGYAALAPANRLDYRTAPSLRVAGVGLVARDTLTEIPPGLVPGDDRFLAVPQPLPRLRFVVRAIPSADPAADLAGIDLAAAALVEAPLALEAGPPGTATLEAEQPGHLRIAAQAPGRQLLVVADRFHTGWHAEIDGQPVPALRVNGDFLGVVVPAGTHAVDLAFRPASLARGKALSLAGLAAWAGLLVVGLRRAARPPVAA